MAEFKDLLVKLRGLKENYNLEIIDSHVHPFDVMGISHFHDYSQTDNSGKLTYKDSKNISNNYFKPGFSEALQHSRFSLKIINSVHKYFPSVVIDSVKSSYSATGISRALREMDYAMVDKVVFLPIEPWVSVKKTFEVYQDNRFYFLGSIDLHKIGVESIETEILLQIKDYRIKGIKLHPNIQNFKPRPKDNKPEIKEKLNELYRVCRQQKIYLLFHGGRSSFIEYIDDKYFDLQRSQNFSLLNNFCEPDGSSELFEEYRLPVVIAHLGHYGQSDINYKLIGKIMNKYDNVYFDTSAVSPGSIKRFIELNGIDKLILGSDAFYNRMIWSIYFVDWAITKAKIKKSEIALAGVLGNNYLRILKALD
jgi:predicted TIM-barrel fold metal-dependent hydrolase